MVFKNSQSLWHNSSHQQKSLLNDDDESRDDKRVVLVPAPEELAELGGVVGLQRARLLSEGHEDRRHRTETRHKRKRRERETK